MSGQEEDDDMQLEDEIVETHGHVALFNACVTDQNIPVIIKRAMRDLKCISLSLEDNRITSDGIKTLVEEMKVNPTLKNLYLSENSLTDISMGYFSELLELSDTLTLTELRLAHTEVTDQGVKLLADALQRNTSLTKLDLSCSSGITDDCLDCVLRMFKQNNTLQKLDLCDCSVSESGKARVQQSFAKRRICLHSDDEFAIEEEVFQNHEDFRLIWLDEHSPNLLDSESIQRIFNELNPTHEVTLFTDLSSTINFIKSIQWEQILLVVCGSLADKTLSRTKSIRAVQAIFIFCSDDDPHKYESLLKDYPVLEGIFTDLSELHICVRDTIPHVQKSALTFSIFDQRQKSIKDFSKESNVFLWHQVLFYVLRQMPADQQAKEEMLDVCMNFYRQSKQHRDSINVYRESESSNQAIQWYSRSTFLFKLLNKALQTEDLVLIYKFRYFIIHLCTQLEDEYRKRENQNFHITVYRGQRISMKELEKLQNNVGLVISMNAFLSTSLSQDVAHMFAPPHSSFDLLFTGVLFQIRIDEHTTYSAVYANIEFLSKFPDEKEVLFSLGSTFKIISVDFDDNLNVWVVKLETSDEGYDRIQEFFRVTDNKLQETSRILYFGSLLHKNLGQANQALKYYHTLLKNLSNDHPDLVEIYSMLGYLHLARGENGIKYFDKIEAMTSKKNDKEIHDEEETLSRSKIKCLQPMKEQAELLMQIGERSSTYDEQLLWCTYALQIYERLFSLHQCPSIVDCLKTIASVHQMKGNYDQSLACYDRIIYIEEQYLPAESTEILNDIKYIVYFYQKTGGYSQALEYCKNKYNSLLNLHGKDHDSVINLHKYMNELNQEREEFLQKTEEYLQKLNTCTSYRKSRRYLSEPTWLYFSQESYSESLQFAIQALNITKVLRPIQPNKIAELLKYMGDCYFHLQKYRRAFRYLNLACSIYRTGSFEWSECQDTIKNIQIQAKKNQVDLCPSSYGVKKLVSRIIIKRLQAPKRSTLFRYYHSNLSIGNRYFRQSRLLEITNISQNLE